MQSARQGSSMKNGWSSGTAVSVALSSMYYPYFLPTFVINAKLCPESCIFKTLSANGHPNRKCNLVYTFVAVIPHPPLNFSDVSTLYIISQRQWAKSNRKSNGEEGKV